jgi:hypothetical protein
MQPPYIFLYMGTLQFYLWYVDYMRRWNELPAKDRALSPKWQPEPVETQNPVKEKDRRSLPRSSLNSPVRVNFEKAISEEFEGKGIKSDGCSFITASARGSVVPAVAEINAQAGLKWQPCMSPSAFLHLAAGAALTQFHNYHPTVLRRMRPDLTPLHRPHLSKRTESFPQRPRPHPSHPPTHHPLLRLRSRLQDR